VTGDDARPASRSPQARFAIVTVGLAIALFLAMLVFFEVGRRLGINAFERSGESARSGVGSVDGAVYALLSLLMGFTFSGAATRFMAKQELLVQESSAIRTVWQRIDAMPVESQAATRRLLREFTDAVIAAHRQMPGSPAETRDSDRIARVREELWSLALASSLTTAGDQARMLVLPSLNELFAHEERERLARQIHPPTVLYGMIGATALAAAMFAGYSMSEATSRNWLHIIGVSATIAFASYVILELEFPTRGLFRVDHIERKLLELRATMT
jgi:predicted nucleic acid-binding protein